MAVTEEINRLAELIWRTVKIRVSLLILTIIVLLVIWSGVLSGDKKALAVDKTFCSQLILDQNLWQQSTFNKLGFVGPQRPEDPNAFCTEQSSRTYIEGARAANEIYPAVFSTDSSRQDLIDLYVSNKTKLANYDGARRNAYALQVQLSSTYSSSAITVNMLSVAEVAPFIALLLMSIVAVLGFQQARYKSDLAKAISEGGGGHPDSGMARAQFFVRPQLAGIRNQFVLSPEKVAIWTLSLAAVLCLFGVLSAFVVDVVHLTDVIYGSYLSWLFTTALLLGSCLAITRRAYAVSPQTATYKLRGGLLNSVEIALTGLGFLSLLLPWTIAIGTIPALEGFRFVAVQKPVALVGETVTQYPIEPRLYSQMRPQVDIALLFIVICGLCVLGRRYNWTWRRWLNRLRFFSGFAVFCLSLNFLLYMAVLEYEAMIGRTWDLGNVFTAALLGGSKYAIGFPLSFYDPSYGFILFLISCFVLIRLSFGRYADLW